MTGAESQANPECAVRAAMGDTCSVQRIFRLVALCALGAVSANGLAVGPRSGKEL